MEKTKHQKLSQNLKARSQKGSRTAVLGLGANILLTIGKFLAGYFGHSRALIADALHSASDISTDITVMIGFHFSAKPADEGHRWGHGKFETISAQVVGVVLVVTGFFIGLNATQSIIDGVFGEAIPKPKYIALVIAFASLLVKEIMYHITAKKARELNSKSLMANAWHHRSDAFSSLGTVIGISGAIFLGEFWRILDPITALFVSFIVIATGVKIVSDAVSELLETALPKEKEDKIMSIITSVKGVSNPHKLRTRHIGHSISIDCHIEVPSKMSVLDAHNISNLVQDALEAEFGLETYIIIHVEPCEWCE